MGLAVMIGALLLTGLFIWPALFGVCRELCDLDRDGDDD